MAGASEPAWVTYAVWWQVYPLGATGADPTGASRAPARGLRHLIDWLDYAVELGASGLALGPIFESASHGYDTIDHFRIDSRLGDDSDFDALVAAVHERGLRLLLDGVFNHVGRGHGAFREVCRDGPVSAKGDWFHLTWPQGAVEEPDYAAFEGHRDLVTLNHGNPEVVDYVASVMTHWLDRGADGWRLDAAYAVPRRFWSAVLSRVRSSHPDAYFIGELIHGDYAAIVADSGLDAVTQYELWKAIWSALNDQNFFELAWALERHNGYLDSFIPLTFVGNHDVTRIASVLDDDRLLAHALVVLLTTGGTPSIYYGDEQAFRGVKEVRVGGDDAIRPALPAGPADLAADGEATYRLHQDLIGLRRRHSWLHGARTEVVTLANQALSYDAVAGPNRLRVVVNIADVALRQPLDGRRPILSGPETVADEGWLELPARGWVVLE